MRVSGVVFSLVVASAAMVLGQEVETIAPGRSVVRSAGHWQNYMHVPDGHCGCPMPVRCGDYTECCRPCGLRPFCFFKRVGRMLDCLLPCNKCCGGGCLIGDCHGCGWFKSHCPKRCGYCDHVGCGEICPSSAGPFPAAGDPFIDDPVAPQPAAPMQPVPAPEAETRSRRAPASSRPYSLSRGAAPHHSARYSPEPAAKPAPRVEREGGKTVRRPAKVAATPGEGPRWIGQSVLRRTSFESEAAEPATLPGIAPAGEILPLSTDFLPPLPAVPSDAASEVDDVPSNPLR